MTKKLSLYIIALLTLMLTACSENDAEPAQATAKTVITIPIQIVSSQSTMQSRAGDPGLDDELQPPKYLYIWSWIQTTDDKYELYYQKMDNLTADDWTYSLGNDSEDQNSMWELKSPVEMNFSGTPKNTASQVGRTYAIASSTALTTEQIEAVKPTNPDETKAAGDYIYSSSPDNTIQSATADLSGWTSTALRDLYSNPVGDTETDGNGYLNGRIMMKSNNPVCGTLRLYHCAAKYDFTWEIPTSLQTSVTIATITLNNLPTYCKFFEPTNNPGTTTASVSLLGGSSPNAVTEGNQWIGRAYTYALQRPDAQLPYTVTFSGKSDVTKTFAPTKNTVFTGWYRVIATVE